MITINYLHHASYLMNTLTYNTCLFLPRVTTKPFFSSYIFTCQLVVEVLLTLASCIGDTRLLTILAYIKDYNPKLLVIIIIIIIICQYIQYKYCPKTCFQPGFEFRKVSLQAKLNENGLHNNGAGQKKPPSP